MTKKSVTVELETGLEARPAAMLVQIASNYESEIYIENERTRVNAKSIMGMMALGLIAGDEVVVSANGKDEEKAISDIEQYLRNN